MSDCLLPHGLCSSWNSPGQNTGVGSLYLLQGIFSTQESNPGLPHCRQMIYHLSHQGSHLDDCSVQFSSVAQLCPTLCNPMNRSTPGLPVHHQLWSSLRLMCIESVMLSSQLILCHPLLLLPPVPPSFPILPIGKSESFPMSQLFA